MILSQRLISSIFTFVLLISSGLSAQVKHIFTPNTPALASQVNENFYGLDSRITRSLTEALDMARLEDDVAADGRLVYALPTFIHKPANIGDLIDVIQGQEYVLGRVPFNDYLSGDKYAITMPMKRISCLSPSSDISAHMCIGDTEYVFKPSLSVFHRDMSTLGRNNTETIEIDGFDGQIYSSAERSYLDITGQMETNTSGYQYQFTNVYSQSLYLFVGTTNLNIAYSLSDIGKDAQNITSNNTPDFTQVMSDSDLNQSFDIADIEKIKNLFNYIRVERL